MPQPNMETLLGISPIYPKEIQDLRLSPEQAEQVGNRIFSTSSELVIEFFDVLHSLLSISEAEDFDQELFRDTLLILEDLLGKMEHFKLFFETFFLPQDFPFELMKTLTIMYSLTKGSASQLISACGAMTLYYSSVDDTEKAEILSGYIIPPLDELRNTIISLLQIQETK